MTRRKKSISHLFSRVSCHYQYPNWCGLWRRTKSIAWRQMHFAGKSFSQVCKNYPHLARDKRRTQFLWVLITSRKADPDLWAGSPRVGNIVTIYHQHRDLHPHKSATEIPTRTAFILLGRSEPELSINYHDPVVNKNQTNTQFTLL